MTSTPGAHDEWQHVNQPPVPIGYGTLPERLIQWTRSSRVELQTPERVVRQGDFVLRPSNPNSEAVHAFLRGLRSVGFEGASLPVEIQANGRERLLFIEGDVAVPPFPAWAQTDQALSSMAALMRSFHEASSRMPCHAQGSGATNWLIRAAGR